LKKYIGEDLETRTNGQSLILSSTILFRGCFIPDYYKLFALKVCDVVHLNIPDKKLMIFLKNLNFTELNIKEDIDQVRALALLHDKPILFLDPLDKAKNILSPIYKDLKVINCNNYD
jgi:hypothetical protein